MRFCAGVLASATLVAAALAAYEPVLDPRAIAEAIAAGQSRVNESPRADQQYRLLVNRPPVDYIEIVTPFRQIVMAARERARAGDRLFTQRQAMEILGRLDRQLEVRVELTFHPLNTFVTVPGYEVVLVTPATGARLPARELRHVARYGRRVDGPAGVETPAAPAAPGSQPLLGASVIARFGSQTLDPTGTYDVSVRESGKEVTRARVNLAAVR